MHTSTKKGGSEHKTNREAKETFRGTQELWSEGGGVWMSYYVPK